MDSLSRPSPPINIAKRKEEREQGGDAAFAASCPTETQRFRASEMLKDPQLAAAALKVVISRVCL
jgi:hypothetical protein